jgi:hypothetical protein
MLTGLLKQRAGLLEHKGQAKARENLDMVREKDSAAHLQQQKFVEYKRGLSWHSVHPS